MNKPALAPTDSQQIPTVAVTTPDPVFDAGAARSVPPYRHEGTARTVGYEQPSPIGQQLESVPNTSPDLVSEKPLPVVETIDLFGINQRFVARVPATEGRYVPPVPAPAK